MTTNKSATDISQPSQQGDGAAAPASLSGAGGGGGAAAAGGKNDNQASRGTNPILKSGPLFISSKGIGWTSWKKRWFILTKTSLVFFRSDPSVVAQKGSEANLTLGGIDLNNSGSVVVKADKKLLTVLFPDGRDGRAFTLKAETSEDLFEWKNALESALAQAPSTGNVMGQNVMGQNGVIRNDQPEAADTKVEKPAVNDKSPPVSLVLGRPILLALEDVDGSPSFLEKALKFIEEHGVRVEGILRQAADVDDVEHRIREYEQGKTDFSPGEDAHVIGDCIKYFLRELPSSPVPASCCHALLDACRSGSRVASMRTAIMETFPEPNRRLLQRILVMMQQVAAHKERNRMSIPAVSACMAPLLLRPLLSGDCEIESDFDVGGDGSMQLLQAAAAANHAQAIVITLMEEYESIFSDGTMSPGLYSDSEEGESEDEELTEDDESYEDEDEEVSVGSEEYSDDYIEDGSNGSCTGSHVSDEDDLADTKMQGSCDLSSHSKPSEVVSLKKEMPSSDQTPILQSDTDRQDKGQNESKKDLSHSGQLLRADSDDSIQNDKSYPLMRKSSSISSRRERRTQWGRTSAKKNLSMESIDFTVEDEETEIQKLEASKAALKKKIAEEAEGNAALQANLQERKKALRERRHALKQDVIRLREQLQMERERRVFQSGLNPADELANIPDTVDEKTKADLKEISEANAEITDLEKEVDKLSVQLIQLHEQNLDSTLISSDQLARSTHLGKSQRQRDAEASTPPPVTGKSTSKDGRIGRTKSSKDKKHESNLNKTDPDSSTSTSFKKSGSKAEELKPSTALTKLTNRLKFLKELRIQASANNELQNADKVTATSSSEKNRGSETRLPRQNPEKAQGSEGVQEGCDNRSRMPMKTGPAPSDSEPRPESHAP